MCSRNPAGAGVSVYGAAKLDPEQDPDPELDLKMDLEDRLEWLEHPVDPEPANELQKNRNEHKTNQKKI